MKEMKILSAVFFTALGGVVLSLGMGVWTEIHTVHARRQAAEAAPTSSIPVPAIPAGPR